LHQEGSLFARPLKRAEVELSPEACRECLPQLQVDDALFLELIWSEVLLREGLGETPALAEYQQRFPQFATELSRRFALRREFTQPLPTATTLPPALGNGPGGQALRVGGYEVLGLLGEGGMGVVYKARHLQLGHEVALKMILGGAHASGEYLARFRLEAAAVARLKHPGIVHLYEFGEHDGRPFFSLELVDGGSLAGKLQADPLTGREAAALVEKVARAVQHAHEAGILHRDLKPANVLLTPGGEPKITDFGLAKQLNSDAGLSITGAVLGTPSYMAPEQAAGRLGDIGPTTDVYALGAILYECLTGQPPFRGSTVQETLDLVSRQEPTRPGRWVPTVPRDLETVCLRCLEKETTKRYATAADLADDLKRYLEGEPVRARPVRSWERAWKWARRRPVVAALLGLVVLLTVAGLGSFFWAYGRALQEATNARRAEKKTQEQLQDTERALANSEVMLADAAWGAGHVNLARDRLDQVPQGLRFWECRYLKRTAGGLFTLYGHTGAVTSICFSPDGQCLATGSADNTAKVWEARTGQELLTLRGHTRSVSDVCFSPDGRRLATGSYDQMVKVWDVRTGQPLLTFKGHTGGVYSVCFSPDGQRLATGGTTYVGLTGVGEVKVWDAHTGQQLLNLREPLEVNHVCFNPDGTRLATGSTDQTVKVWDVRTGQRLLLLKGRTGGVHGICFSPDGTRLAAGKSTIRTVEVWDARTGQQLPDLNGHTDGVQSVSFSPDGTRLATASHDQTVKVWDVRTGEQLLTLLGHTTSVTGVCFSPDGHRLASGSGQTYPPGSPSEVKVWDAQTGQELLTLKGHTWVVTGVCFSPDGHRLASGSYDSTVKVWDARTTQEVITLRGHTAGVNSVCFSPDGQHLATAGGDKTAKVWDTRTGRQLLDLQAQSWVRSVCFSADGLQLVSTDGGARPWSGTPGPASAWTSRPRRAPPPAPTALTAGSSPGSTATPSASLLRPLPGNCWSAVPAAASTPTGTSRRPHAWRRTSSGRPSPSTWSRS
jgi:WD40 repeat protein